MLLALLGRPSPLHVAPDKLRIDVEERTPDVLGEIEVRGKVTAIVIVVEYSPDPARLAPVRQVKIFIAPCFELAVVHAIAPFARLLHRCMKINTIGIVLAPPMGQHRRQVGSPAEPPFRGHDEPSVHMRRRNVRAPGMGDERNP